MSQLANPFARTLEAAKKSHPHLFPKNDPWMKVDDSDNQTELMRDDRLSD